MNPYVNCQVNCRLRIHVDMAMPKIWSYAEDSWRSSPKEFAESNRPTDPCWKRKTQLRACVCPQNLCQHIIIKYYSGLFRHNLSSKNISFQELTEIYGNLEYFPSKWYRYSLFLAKRNNRNQLRANGRKRFTFLQSWGTNLNNFKHNQIESKRVRIIYLNKCPLSTPWLNTFLIGFGCFSSFWATLVVWP